MVENLIDWFKVWKNQIAFNKNKQDSKEENRLEKKLKINLKGKIYMHLLADIIKETLNKFIVIRYCTSCNTEGYTLYICKKDIKIRAIVLNNEININY